jgi:hypothetical protein
MAKSKMKRSIRPRGQNPVIAVRVSAPLHKRITAAAKTSRKTMSEQMASMLERAFEWQDAFGDRLQMLREANAEAERIRRGILESELRRLNWRRQHGTPYWVPPEVHGLPPDGFIDPPAAETNQPAEETTQPVEQKEPQS